MREVRISANTQGRSLGEVVNDIKLQAAALNLPPGYSIALHRPSRGHDGELRIRGASR